MKKKVFIFTDGAARGNPGPAGIGAVIKSPEGELFKEISVYLGETTNNQAEYKALIAALKEAVHFGAEQVGVFADSELMVRQINGIYKVKNEDLKPLFNEAVLLMKKFKGVKVTHIPREKNKEADKLANKAIDSHFGEL